MKSGLYVKLLLPTVLNYMVVGTFEKKIIQIMQLKTLHGRCTSVTQDLHKYSNLPMPCNCIAIFVLAVCLFYLRKSKLIFWATS